MEGHYGKYRAVIKDVHDPERLGRIRAYCPAIFGEEWSEWAYPNFPPNFFSLPEEGAFIWLEFEQGNPEFPIWTGVWYDRSFGAPGQGLHKVLTDKDGAELDHDKSEHETHPIDSVERKPFRNGQYYDPHTTLFTSTTGLEIKIEDNPDKSGGFYVKDRAGNEIILKDDEGDSLLLSDMNGNTFKMNKNGIFIENAHGVKMDLASTNIYFNGQSFTANVPGGVAMSPSGSSFTQKVLTKVKKPFNWRTKKANTDPTVK